MSSCSARAGTLASKVPVERRVEPRLLDRQPVGVGRDHAQLLADGRDEDAGQHRPRLVARGRAGDLEHRLDERRRPGPRRGRRPPPPGTAGSPPGAACGCGTSRVAAHELDVLLGRPQLERHLVARQRPHDVDEQPRRQHDGAVAHDLALERDAQADLHVGGAQLDRAVASPGAGRRRAPGRRCGSRPPGSRSAAARTGRRARVEIFIAPASPSRHRCREMSSKFRVVRGVDGVHRSCDARLRCGSASCTRPVDEPPESFRQRRTHSRVAERSVRRRTVS